MSEAGRKRVGGEGRRRESERWRGGAEERRRAGARARGRRRPSGGCKREREAKWKVSRRELANVEERGRKVQHVEDGRGTRL
eukprot:4829869-Pleurochrysis_carterae.AAC.2